MSTFTTIKCRACLPMSCQISRVRILRWTGGTFELSLNPLYTEYIPIRVRKTVGLLTLVAVVFISFLLSREFLRTYRTVIYLGHFYFG
jgi:hypothetical protein